MGIEKTRTGVARDSCSCRDKNMRAQSIPLSSKRVSTAPHWSGFRRPDWSALLTRINGWRKRAQWLESKLKALPKAIRVVVLSLALVAVFFVTNLVYHIVHKPTEVFSPVSGGFNKTPIETW